MHFFLFYKQVKRALRISGDRGMMMMIRFMNKTLASLQDAIHKAVPAVNRKGVMPRWRNLGRAITPYHFMQPVPVPVQQRKN